MKDRRFGNRVVLKLNLDEKGLEFREFDITFNRDPDTGVWSECFYSPTDRGKIGSEFHALLTDACIAVSKLRERGATFTEMAGMFGENRAPGAERGPPASILGAICQHGAFLERQEGV